jgi:hypothetical protein
MKRLRIILATVFALSTIALVAPSPAYACEPEEGQPCCEEDINRLWNKFTGGDLIHCPW